MATVKLRSGRSPTNTRSLNRDRSTTTTEPIRDTVGATLVTGSG